MSDFDNTLFKRNVGLIEENVSYLESQKLPVYIVTFRAENQRMFLSETLSGTDINIMGYVFIGDRKQDPVKKLSVVNALSQHYNIVEALDDDREVVVRLLRQGINARQV